MAIYVKGNTVENATSYELFEKVGGTYTSLATASEINFDVSALAFSGGNHVLVVKAKGEGYADSNYSNEVIYALPDDDVTAFLTKTGISDPAMTDKISTLVGSLKQNNLWDKIDALYPCVGSTFDSMSYNLKDVSTYRLTTTGTPTVTENVGFYCTAPVVSDTPSHKGSDLHTVGYSGTAVSELNDKLLCPGPSSSTGSIHGVLGMIGTSKILLRTAQDTNRWYKEPFQVDGKGLFMGSLTSGILYNGQNTGAAMEGTPNIANYACPFMHNGYDVRGTNETCVSPFQVRLSGFGNALTIEEMQKYSEILNEFKDIY